MSRAPRAPLAALLLLSLLTGCGGARRPDVTLPPAPPRDEAALRAAVDAYYAATDPAGLRAAVAQARAAGADTALHHEVAADLARFEDRPGDQVNHLLAALLDVQADAPLVYLHRLADLHWTLDERARLEGLLTTLQRDHPDAETRAFAAWVLAHSLHLRGDAPRRDAALARVGGRLPLAVIGTFDNDQGKGFDAVYPPERGVDLKARYAGKLMEIGWRTDAERDPRGKTDLGELMSPQRWQVAYGATAFEVKEAGTYELRISSSDPVKVWVNDGLVFAGRRLNNWLFDGLVLRIELRAGVNRVLLKSAQEGGAWLLAARVTGPGAAPLPDGALTPVAADTPYAGEPAADAPIDEEGLLALHVARLPAEAARTEFLKAVWADDMGLAVPQVRHAEAYLQRAPESLRGRYLLAKGLWNAQERGRTADLLESLSDAHGDALPFLHLQRARFWRQQRLETKARALLTKVRDAHPDRPGAALELADLFEREGWHEDRCRTLEGLHVQRPGWPRVMLALADCYEELRFYPRAERLYLEILDALPNSRAALRSVQWLALGNDDFDRATRYAERLVEGWPHERTSWARLGETRRRAHDRAGAEAAYRAIVEMAPTAPDGYDRLAHLALQARADQAAVAQWKEALARDPDNAALANRLAFLAPAEEGPWLADVPDEAAIAAAIEARGEVAPAKGADVIYLMDDEVTLLGADGSTVNVVTLVAHAVNQGGRDQLTRLRVRSGGRHRILTAYAVGPDGRRIEASSLRGREVRFRQLEVGATVVLQYRIEERPESYLAGHMSRRWWFQAPGYQTHRGRWVLWMPKGTALHDEVLGPVKRDERAAGELVRLAWSAEDTPPIVVEPGMPNPSEWAAHVVMSTVPDWEMFWKWEKALLQDAFRESPELVALAERLKKDAPDKQTVVDRIHAYLMSDIRYEQDYEGVIAGVKPHAAPQVVARRYGDCKDKAVLFITLANLADIDVHFALVRTRDAGPVVRGVPMQQFNHAIVYVPAQEGIAEGRFYDPTVDALDVEVLRQDDQGTWSLVFDPDAGEHAWREIPFQPASLDFTRSDTALSIGPEGAAKGELELSAQGRGGQVLRVASRNPEKFGQLLQNQVAAAYPGGRLLGFDTVQVEGVMEPARLRLALESPGLGKREGAQLRVPLPMGWNPSPWFRLEKRRHPLLLGAPRSFQWRFEIEVPAGARDLETPAAADVAARCLTFQRRFETKGNTVVAELQATIACERILPEEYAAHREAAERIVELLDQDITMTVKGTGKVGARAER